MMRYFIQGFVMVVLVCSVQADEMTRSQVKSIGNEIIFSKRSQTYKWEFAPEISVEIENGDPGLAEFLRKKNAELVRLTSLKPGEARKIKVFVDTEANLQKALRTEKVSKYLGGECAYWSQWGWDEKIDWACIVIPSTLMADEKTKMKLLRGLLWCYGFPQPTKLLKEGCFSIENSTDTSLSEFDKKFISFYYTHVPAKANYGEFRRIVDEKWESLVQSGVRAEGESGVEKKGISRQDQLIIEKIDKYMPKNPVAALKEAEKIQDREKLQPEKVRQILKEFPKEESTLNAVTGWLESGSGTSAANERWIGWLLQEWGAVDPESAIHWLSMRMKSPYQKEHFQRVMRGWEKRDWKAALRWVEENAEKENQRDLVCEICRVHAEVNAPETVRWVEESSYKENPELLGNIATAWIKSNTDAALSWIANYPEKNKQGEIRNAMMRRWLEMDPRTGLEWLERVFSDNTQEKEEWLDKIMDPLLRVEIQKSYSFIEGLQNAETKRMALRRMARWLDDGREKRFEEFKKPNSLSLYDPVTDAMKEVKCSGMEEVVQVYNQFTEAGHYKKVPEIRWKRLDGKEVDERVNLEKKVGSTLKEVIENIEKMPEGDDKFYATQVMGEEWIRWEPEAVVKWLAKSSEVGKLAKTIEEAIRQWAKKKPAEAAPWVFKNLTDPDRHRRESYLLSAFEAWGTQNPVAGMEWLRSAGEDADAAYCIEVVLQVWVGKRKSGLDAVQWVMNNRPEGDARERGVSAVLRRWVLHNPSAALEWVCQLPAGSATAQWRKCTLEAWVAKDSGSASSFVKGMEKGVERNECKKIIAHVWKKTHPLAAMEWVRSFQDRDDLPLMGELFADWMETDQEKALNWLKKVLTENQRIEVVSSYFILLGRQQQKINRMVFSLLPDSERAEVILRMADRCEEKQIPEILRIVEGLSDEGKKSQILCTIGCRLAKNDPEGALELAKKISNEKLRWVVEEKVKTAEKPGAS